MPSLTLISLTSPFRYTLFLPYALIYNLTTLIDIVFGVSFTCTFEHADSTILLPGWAHQKLPVTTTALRSHASSRRSSYYTPPSLITSSAPQWIETEPFVPQVDHRVFRDKNTASGWSMKGWWMIFKYFCYDVVFTFLKIIFLKICIL